MKRFVFGLWVVWTLVTTLFTLFFVYGYPKGLPFPFPDSGHCTFEAQSVNAGRDVAESLEEVGALKDSYTFKSGNTVQTVMTDNRTVWLFKPNRGEVGDVLSGNSRSFVVKNPLMAATKFVSAMSKRGWVSRIYDATPESSPPESLFIVETPALVNAVIVFRRHSMSMGPLNRTR